MSGTRHRRVGNALAMTWRLYCSGRGPLVEVMPDERYSGMWRIRTRDGRLSDMLNLARAKDAARLVARDENPALHDVAKLHWKKDSGKSRQEGPTALQNAVGARKVAEQLERGLVAAGGGA